MTTPPERDAGAAGRAAPAGDAAPPALAVDGARVVSDLRELARLTADERGAQRVAWSERWASAREWLVRELAPLPVTIERDEAGNLWAELTTPARPGAPVIALGSHLDSVPDGGWLDGALGVVAALEILRAAARSGWDHATLRLVDWADEEGARFGHSLLGSSAATGLLDVEAAALLRDRDGVALPDALAAHGVTLADAPAARARLLDLDALLELHIEQGPVLEESGAPLAAPSGAVAIARLRLVFDGRAGHAGTTPMALRADAGLAAARAALAARRLAVEAGGLATSGALRLEPGIATAVAGHAELLLDLRHERDDALAALGDAIAAAVAEIAAEEHVAARIAPVWSSPAVAFDPPLVAAAREAAIAANRSAGAPALVSGALHDAVAVARSGVPTAMMFVRSVGGISHNPAEDSSERDLELAVGAFAATIERAARR
ncbi:hydantoinase/carbamoylase family amidase [Conexibacter stalactiti]|uniref:Hydantoinase/carbamoylase family amidase n=1 Tax=Conexibacter stalactiti TaxID=1940611 RepID=A0ABU4HJB4_9ACTN|nr:hydantoinase/carbamoylase family amidase [Conexibacter stalactiti]MDW5593396.1 hydantoinase/carbamoylase family amidase [Conexibacter stalactiti]MEC5034037.1 hydantoinase/carbamoylase family amidase [Conexibacter stalactiti]